MRSRKILSNSVRCDGIVECRGSEVGRTCSAQRLNSSIIVLIPMISVN